MLTLILSKDWVAGRNEILGRVAQDVAEEKPGRILMVPELISHDTERRLCAAAGDTASRFAEVLSFPRLAARVAEKRGKGTFACLDSGGRIVTMAAAARQLHSRLKAYACVETKPEFLAELVEAVDEFKRCCISSQDLAAASAQTTGTLAQKLEELALLMESYDALCAQGKADPRDQMTWLLEQLEEDDFAETHTFYIDGFPDYTSQHMAILAHLIRVSPQVTVSLNCDRIGSDGMAFEKAGDTVQQILRIAKEMEIPVRIETVDTDETPLLILSQRLFQGKLPEPEIFAGTVTAVRAESVSQEVQAAADRVMELVRSGCRYRDISIVCADMGLYQSQMRLTFRRCGIPLYQAGTEDILQKTVIATVLSAMEAALGGFEQGDVLRYLRSVLSPVEVDICDRMENYIITWGVRGNAFLRPWSNHPDGLSGRWNEKSQSEIQILEEARERAMAPLAQLRTGFQQGKNLAQQVQSLYRFLEEIDLAGRLEQLTAEMDDLGEHRDAQILSQLWDILLSALEQLHDTLGQTVWEPEVFVRLLTLLLSQYDVGTIPPVLDAVTVGPVSACRCQEVKHLLVLGAVEGALPGYGGSAGLLTDQERTALRDMGVPLTGGAVEGLQAEFAEIYGVFCGARETVYVSCPGGDGSYLYRRVAQMAGGEIPCGESLGAAAFDERERGTLLARYHALEEAKRFGVWQWYAETEKRCRFEIGNVSPAHIETLYGKTLRLSASQIDKQATCRMAYFLQYGLGAKERKENTVDPAEFGSYVHDVLEHTARDVMELGGFEAVSLEKTLDLAYAHSERYAQERFAQMETQRLRYLFQRNWRELEMVVQELWEELSTSKFRPRDFELRFGSDGKLPAIRIPGSVAAVLQGFVDRVDIWQTNGMHYFRVVDYKTGKKDFDYCDILSGVGLQMLLYLFALEQAGEAVIGGHPIAAGVQYFPARVPLVTADGRMTDEEAEKARIKEWKRKGLLLEDEDVLAAMEPGGEMRRLSCTRRKDGTLSGDLADREQLKMLRSYVFGVLSDLVDQIASGTIAPNPYSRGSSYNACAYCPYGSICHKSEVKERRNFKTVTAQRFWEEVEKEVGHNG